MNSQIRYVKYQTKMINNVIRSFEDGHITEDALFELVERQLKRIIGSIKYKDHELYFDKKLNRFVFGIPKKS